MNKRETPSGCYPPATAIIILIILIIISACSCSTLEKTKSYFKDLTDKDSVTKTIVVRDSTADVTHVVKDNGIRTIINDGETTRETIIEFDTTRTLDTAILDGIYNRGSARADDYFPHITQPIKRITIKETGKTHVVDNQIANTVDSSHNLTVTHNDSKELTHVKASELSITSNKEVSRTHYNLLLLLLLIPAARVAYNIYNKRPIIS